DDQLNDQLDNQQSDDLQLDSEYEYDDVIAEPSSPYIENSEVSDEEDIDNKPNESEASSEKNSTSDPIYDLF
ncbi:26146_t:CDS:1, partial [Racocetra persica]